MEDPEEFADSTLLVAPESPTKTSLDTAQKEVHNKQVWTKSTAIRTPFYIIAALAISSNSAFSTGFMFNIISILENHGLTKAEAV